MNGALSLCVSYVYFPWIFTTASQQNDVMLSKAAMFYPPVSALTYQVYAENIQLAQFGCTSAVTVIRNADGSDDPFSRDLTSYAGGPYPVDDDGTRPLPDIYYRVREGIERFLITDINNPAASSKAQSTIPIMFDAWSSGLGFYSVLPEYNINNTVNMNHAPGGSNVLYMDGHIEFIRLGSVPVFPGNPFTYAIPHANDGSFNQYDLAVIMSIAGGAV